MANNFATIGAISGFHVIADWKHAVICKIPGSDNRLSQTKQQMSILDQTFLFIRHQTYGVQVEFLFLQQCKLLYQFFSYVLCEINFVVKTRYFCISSMKSEVFILSLLLPFSSAERAMNVALKYNVHNAFRDKLRDRLFTISLIIHSS